MKKRNSKEASRNVSAGHGRLYLANAVDVDPDTSATAKILSPVDPCPEACASCTFAKLEPSHVGSPLKDYRPETATAVMSRAFAASGSEPGCSPSVPGRRIILPATHSGSPRELQQCYLDAMTIVQRYGKPDLFITMTANPSWPEIVSNLRPGEKASNRPDLTSRIRRLLQIRIEPKTAHGTNIRDMDS